jgi:hypothetical protein
MVWLCKLHRLGLAAPRPGADGQLDHFLAWLEKETGADPPTIGTVVLGRVEGGPEPNLIWKRFPNRSDRFARFIGSRRSARIRFFWNCFRIRDRIGRAMQL